MAENANPEPIPIDNVDAIRKFISDQAGPEKAEQVVGKLKVLLDKVQELPPEERKAYLEEFSGRMRGIKENIQQKVAEKVQLAITINIIVQIVVYVIIAALILWTLVFIGRKLYRHLKAKEEKQSGKKKVKEGKKGSKQPKEDSKKGKKSQDEREKSPKKKK